MSAAEIIDILNEDGEVIGTIPREEAEQGNHITENVLVFLYNSLGKVWTQLRPQTKKHFPGTWDISVCGGIRSGEAPEQAAARETLEETGLEAQLHRVETFLNVFEGDNGEQRKRISHLFVGITDATPTADKTEVDEFRLWD